jgi:steroid delta-isomerase
MPAMPAPDLRAVIDYWETLSPETIPAMTAVYDADVYFRDPFHEFRGHAALTTLLEQMFARLDAPRFEVLETALQAGGAVLIWDFHYRFKGRQAGVPRVIHGASHLRFADDGRVVYHRDYWDAAGEVYEQLPLLGSVLRWVRRRFA